MTKLKVMSLNLMTDSLYPIGDKRFSIRYKAILSLIHQEQPDLIGIQELTPTMFAFLQSLFTDYEIFGDSRHSFFYNEYSSVLYRKDRFQKTYGTTKWLSSKPDKPSSHLATSMFPRIVTIVHLLDKQTNEEFTFANTHLDANLPSVRTLQAIILTSILFSEQKGNIILTGDFNTISTSDALKALTKLNIKDAINDTIGSTLVGPLGSRSHEYKPIDHIFVSNNIQITKSYKVTDTFNGIQPSDHYPVVAQIEIGNAL